MHGKSKSIADDVQKEIEEIPNACDAEEVDENENDEVCKHWTVCNRKKKAWCGMCTKENVHNKSQTKKKESEEKDGLKHTKSIFERAAQIMKKKVQIPPPKVDRKNPQLLYSQMGLA